MKPNCRKRFYQLPSFSCHDVDELEDTNIRRSRASVLTQEMYLHFCGLRMPIDDKKKECQLLIRDKRKS